MSQRGAWSSCRASGATWPRVQGAAGPQPLAPVQGTGGTHRGGSVASSPLVAPKLPPGWEFVPRGAVLACRATGVPSSDQNKPCLCCGELAAGAMCGKCQPCCRAQSRVTAQQGRHNWDAVTAAAMPEPAHIPKAKVVAVTKELGGFWGQGKTTSLSPMSSAALG